MRIIGCEIDNYVETGDETVHVMSLEILEVYGVLENPEDADKYIGEYERYKQSSLALIDAISSIQGLGEGLELLEGNKLIAGEKYSVDVLEVPEGVEEIGDSGFRGIRGLERVILPKSLKKIGEYAFMGCKDLVEIEYSVSLEEIGAGAFKDTGLTGTQKLPVTLKKVGSVSIFPKGVTSVSVPYRMSKSVTRKLANSGLEVLKQRNYW